MKHFVRKKEKNSQNIEIYGFHAVKAALSNNKRKHQKLILSQSHKNLNNHNVKKKVKEIVELTNKEMFKLYGGENAHQGIVLITTNLNQPNINEILEKSNNNEIVIMLDQVTDPNNIGSIMRSCSLFNCKSIILPKDSAPNITSSIAKAASGALETVNYIKVTNLSRTIEKFKENDYWVCGLDNNKKNSNNIFEIPNKCLLIFGSESKGLRNLTRKKCDFIITIPINSNKIFQIDSLNISNACSIALYEHFKKFN